MSEAPPPRPKQASKRGNSLLNEALAPLEIARELLLRGSPASLPRGDGHPVFLLPAFTTGERELRPLVEALMQLGYAVQRWDEGRNLGLRVALLDRLIGKLEQVVTDEAKTASLIGWSGGGLYAREMARARPALVRRVITLGTPIRLAEAGPAFVEIARKRVEGLIAVVGVESFEPMIEPPPVPCTALYSKRDGIVAWRAAMEAPGPDIENIEVRGSHLGLPYRREVLAILAQRLAQPPR